MRSYAFLAAGLALMLGAHRLFGAGGAGDAALFAGLALYAYGWRGICPACQAGRCDLQPKDVVKPRG